MSFDGSVITEVVVMAAAAEAEAEAERRRETTEGRVRQQKLAPQTPSARG